MNRKIITTVYSITGKFIAIKFIPRRKNQKVHYIKEKMPSIL